VSGPRPRRRRLLRSYRRAAGDRCGRGRQPRQKLRRQRRRRPRPRAAKDVPVDIRDFAIHPNRSRSPSGIPSPGRIKIRCRTTTTSDNRDVFQSGAISPGSSFSHTFTTAGEFAYHCEFHPNMTGTIVVK